MDFSLLQNHTIQLYGLASKTFSIEKIKARDLLSVSRFDLFAKLYYARNRKSNCEQAREVYLKHIKVFNPDAKEPGRDDKNSFDDFINAFDFLLDYFEKEEFDEKRSIIPVSSEGIILDGAHRVAALAYYDKDVTIARFDNVSPIAQFDYKYFKHRGLPQDISDIIAQEIIRWKQNSFVACLWPRMGNNTQKQIAIDTIEKQVSFFYYKSFKVNLKALTLFIAKVYKEQDWVGTQINGYAGARNKALNCYSKNNCLDVGFFTTNKSLSEILELKDKVRNLYSFDKHSIHITDNNVETKDIAFLTLSPKGINQWFYVGRLKKWQQLKQSVSETIYIFKNTYWIDFKVFVASRLGKIKKCKLH